jgi:hypothetical protein
MAETCQIIEQGLGKAAADTYRTNAANAEMAKAAQKIKPLNGKQTEYLYRLYHEKALSPYQVQLLLGVATPRRDLLPEVPISPIEADKFFRQLGRIVKNGQPQLELLETAVDSRGQGKGATR